MCAGGGGGGGGGVSIFSMAWGAGEDGVFDLPSRVLIRRTGGLGGLGGAPSCARDGWGKRRDRDSVKKGRFSTPRGKSCF